MNLVLYELFYMNCFTCGFVCLSHLHIYTGVHYKVVLANLVHTTCRTAGFYFLWVINFIYFNFIILPLKLYRNSSPH